MKYCGVSCQKEHRPQHKRECKKRAAELRDEILFKQPESSHYGDCPICCLPLFLDGENSHLTLMTCCSKVICDGCAFGSMKREYERHLQHKCPFCRKPMPETEEEMIELLMKRVEANDPVAMCYMGTKRLDKGDDKSAFDYFTRAATLGDALAHHKLACLYHYGEGVGKDKKKELHHEQQAAIGGHPGARNNIGHIEWDNGRMDRAVKHWIIAAKLGHDNALKNVKNVYEAGFVSKDDFAEALRGHQAAIDATKSPQREEAAEAAESEKLPT